MHEVKIPAPLYDAALNFCNERLAEQGKRMIDTLPPGEPMNPYTCPCGSATGLYIGTMKWCRKDEAVVKDRDMDDEDTPDEAFHTPPDSAPEHGLCAFIRAFDFKGIPRKLNLPVRDPETHGFKDAR